MPTAFPTLADALTHWASPRRPARRVISILDSRTYALPADDHALPTTTRLAIEAANGERPLLDRPRPAASRSTPTARNPDPEQRGRLALSGVVVEGFVRVTGDLGELRLLHATLVPGRSIAEGAAPSTARASSSTRRRRRHPDQHASRASSSPPRSAGRSCARRTRADLDLSTAIVDGLGGRALGGRPPDGPRRAVDDRALDLPRHAPTYTSSRRASRSSPGVIDTARTQAGCVRFSFVPRGSRTPRRHRCQPDLASAPGLDAALAADPGLTQPSRTRCGPFVARWLVPSFIATQYGQPAYCQLRTVAAPPRSARARRTARRWASYCQLKQPQRESNLRIRLDEYLPFGLEAGRHLRDLRREPWPATTPA